MDWDPCSTDEVSSIFGRNSLDSNDSIADVPGLFDDSNSSSGESTWDSESEEEQLSFRDKLRNLFIDIDLEQSKGTAILKLLREHPCFSSLPADHRTLVGTPQEKIQLKEVEPGEYLHLGVEKMIINYLEESNISPIPEDLQMDFNTDGANLDTHGFIVLWPIQIRIANIPKSPPIIVGIYKGKKKPMDVNLFMEDFVNETNEILTNDGILYKNKRIRVVLRCFIADAPARAMILNCLYPSGHNSCSKCNLAGVPRTDEDYRNQIDDEHHHGPSAIAKLPIDLVNQTVFDYLHLTLIGAVKRQIWATVKGAPNISKNVKLSALEIHTINARLLMIRNFCPREFSRLPSNITDYDRMKGTEFRQIILYTGPVIFYGIYKEDVYDHFLLHHTALRCLVAPHPSPIHIQYARVALEEWKNSSGEIYGARFRSYNINCQPHLVDDVVNFGHLDSYSAFPYESNNRVFRQMCRKPHAPLQQIYRRVVEKSNRKRHLLSKNPSNDAIKASQIHHNGPLLMELRNTVQYQLLQTADFTLGINTHDNCCILKDSSICIVRNILMESNGNVKHHYLLINKFDAVQSWFNTGIDSTEIGSFKCFNLNPELIRVEHTDVEAKCYRMPYWSSPTSSGMPPIQPLDDTYIVTVMMHRND